jgi:hypothetical protein
MNRVPRVARVARVSHAFFLDALPPPNQQSYLL